MEFVPHTNASHASIMCYSQGHDSLNTTIYQDYSLMENKQLQFNVHKNQKEAYLYLRLFVQDKNLDWHHPTAQL